LLILSALNFIFLDNAPNPITIPQNDEAIVDHLKQKSAVETEDPKEEEVAMPLQTTLTPETKEV